MAYDGSNDDVIDDVTWPWKVKFVLPISFRLVILKRLELETWLQRDTYRKWHARYRMVTWSMTSRDLKGKGRDPNIFKARYFENNSR